MSQSTRSFFFASGYASAEQPGIQSFSFDGASGEIKQVGSYTGVNAPSYILPHPNGKWLYAVSETGQGSHGVLGSVWSFQFTREPFSIEPINQQTTRGDWPCHLQLGGTGKWLIATNYGTGNVAIYPIQADGSLGEMTDFVQHQGKGPNAARQEGPHAHSSIFTPDNRFVIIADLGIDQLVVYKFDSVTGKLSLHTSVNTTPEAGPRHLAFHSNKKWLYAANELNSTVTLYDYDSTNSTVLERQNISSIPADSPENIIADIHISSDGKHLYVSNRGHNSIAVYDINDNGSLTLISIPACGGNWPRNFALAPNGQFVLAANQYSNEVCVLPILAGQEALGAPVARTILTGASCIQFINP